MKYVNVCTYPLDLNDGRTLEPSGVVDLEISGDNVHDQAYVTRGVLAVVPEEGSPEPVDNKETEGKKGGKK